MKKFLIILFSAIIILLGVWALSKYIANTVTDRFDAKTSSEPFEINYNLIDEPAIIDIQQYLENNYERVTADLKKQLDDLLW